MGKGYQGLLKFRSHRAAANRLNKRVGDCFHDGSTIIPIVFQCHSDVEKVLRACDRITPGVLKMIEEHILLEEPESRLGAKQLWFRANLLVDGEKASPSSDTHNQNRGSSSTNIPSSPPPPHISLSTAGKGNDKAFINAQKHVKTASTSKKRAANSKLPRLSFREAQDWKKAKTGSEKLINRFLKRHEVPKLGGEWLFGRVGKRDHVRIESLFLLPHTFVNEGLVNSYMEIPPCHWADHLNRFSSLMMQGL